MRSGGIALGSVGKHAHRPFSQALSDYARIELPRTITQVKEIERVKTGISLFIEFEGDLMLSEIDGDKLRNFRDKHLSRMPARENHIRTKHGSKSMTESITAVAGTDWPKLSANERDLRMQWIARMFRWLHDQKWINDDPSTALRSESVLTKAQKAAAVTAHRKREEFSADDLDQIFSAQWCWRRPKTEPLLRGMPS